MYLVSRHISMFAHVYLCILNSLLWCLAISMYIYVDKSSALSVRACGARRSRLLVSLPRGVGSLRRVLKLFHLPSSLFRFFHPCFRFDFLKPNLKYFGPSSWPYAIQSCLPWHLIPSLPSSPLMPHVPSRWYTNVCMCVWIYIHVNIHICICNYIHVGI